ncbi:unnamed protein product [Heterobilharzia americana]|nr:unnamed protein product [Heterobilharzia americana]
MEWEWTLQTVNWRINNLLRYCHPDDNHEHTELWSGYHDIPNTIEGSHAVGTNLLQDHGSKIQLKRKEGHNHTMLHYAPTNNAEQEKKEEFYRQLHSTLNKASVGDIKILMGDMNAKLGGDNRGRELTMGREALGEVMNENGELFAEFCAFNDLVIGGSVFKHKDIHKATWISPDTLKIKSTLSQSQESGDAVY